MKRLGIGVRVRVVDMESVYRANYIGKEGVICRRGNVWAWIVEFGFPLNTAALSGKDVGMSISQGGFDSWMLIPIEDDTNNSTDEWAREKVKRLDRFYVEPSVEKVNGPVLAKNSEA